MKDLSTDLFNCLNRRTFLKAAGGAALVLSCGLTPCSCSRKKGELAEEELNYYTNQDEKLTEEFNKAALMQKELLLSDFGESRVNKWTVAARDEFKSLIPRLPYIGGDENSMTRFLVISAILMPWVKVLRENEVPMRRNGRMIYDMANEYYDRIPAPIRWYLGWSNFWESRKEKTRAAAELSGLRRYPDDWVYEFVEGDGEGFEYGIDMTECGLVKFWGSQGLGEFVPYLCLTDWAFWKAVGIRAARTQTIANGGDRCDFRYVGRGEVGRSGWPPESNPEWTGIYEA